MGICGGNRSGNEMKNLSIPVLKRKILLAEDNLVNQEVVMDMLEQLGYHIDVVNNGKEAVEACRKENYSLVLMDYRMPVLDGLKATEKIRFNESQQQTPPVPIVALTAHAITGVRDRCLNSGMNDFLSKPFGMDDIYAVVKKWMPLGSDCGAASITPSAQPVNVQAQYPLDTQSAQKNVIIDAVMINRLRQSGQQKKNVSTTKVPLLVRVINMYLGQTPDLLLKLSTAMAEKNVTHVVDIAHSLRSSSQAVGALTMADGCREIERAGCEEVVDMRLLEQKTLEIHNKYQQVEMNLKEILNSEN